MDDEHDGYRRAGAEGPGLLYVLPFQCRIEDLAEVVLSDHRAAGQVVDGERASGATPDVVVRPAR